MPCRDPYGYALTTSPEAAAAYSQGLLDVLRLQSGALPSLAASIAHDPTFALGHAALALLGHELCAAGRRPGPAARRLAARRAAAPSASAATCTPSSQHVAGDSRPLVAHLRRLPAGRAAALDGGADDRLRRRHRGARGGVVDRRARGAGVRRRLVVHRAAGLRPPGAGPLRRGDVRSPARSLALEPGAGHSAHARAHAHYETGDHAAGLAWMDGWVTGDGASIDSISHFAWHAALHELSLGDLDAVRRRYDGQLRPEHGLGCRALVDTGSLLFRWALTPDAADVPGLEQVAALAGRRRPRAAGDAVPGHAQRRDAARRSTTAPGWTGWRGSPTRTPTRPSARWSRRWPGRSARLAAGRYGDAADALAALASGVPRLGGSDAQREILEETRIAALVRADRLDEARALLDARLDRRHSPRDRRWREPDVDRHLQARRTRAAGSAASGQADLVAARR